MSRPHHELPCYTGFAGEIEADDARQTQWARQFEARGFDSTELWNLDVSLSLMIAPRLRGLAQETDIFPSDLDEQGWRDLLVGIAEVLDDHADDPSPLLDPDGGVGRTVRLRCGLEELMLRWRDLWY